jgi:hypothetical protein
MVIVSRGHDDEAFFWWIRTDRRWGGMTAYSAQEKDREIKYYPPVGQLHEALDIDPGPKLLKRAT